jgi:hypothetical protein
MPKGLKSTSSVVAVGFSVTESAPNIFTEEQIDLALDPLNNEVFVVLAINLEGSSPDAIAATNTSVSASVTTVTQTALAPLSNSNCLTRIFERTRAQGYVDGGVAFSSQAMETPPAILDYIGIIATNNFFCGVQGENNIAAKTMTGKLYGYRARADASVYAALVQSEVLSA